MDNLNEKPDLLLLDIIIPKLNGFEVLKIIKGKEDTRFIPVVVITSLDDRESKIKAIKLGADDFITKPFDVTELNIRIKNLLKIREYYYYSKSYSGILEAEVRTQTQELKKAYQKLKEANLDTIYRLSSAAEYRDDSTGKHIRRISDYSTLIAENIGLSSEDVELIHITSAMHDIGKIGLSDAILLKPAKLTSKEYEAMKKHTTIGGEILADSKSEMLKSAQVIALSHHEKFDGRGYPFQLKGKSIPLFARIVAVADVYDALVTPRVYKPSFSKEVAFSILWESKETHFDPEIVDVFLKNVDKVVKIMKTHL